MLKITARTAEAFNEIESALLEFDEHEVFLKYFDMAVQSEADVEGITVILRNTKKFKKDLNKRKYVISIPTTLVIDAFEMVKKYETKGGKRVPFYSVLVKGHLAQSGVNIILILVGFNDDAIRILSHDDFSGYDEDNEDGADENSNALNNRDVYNMCRPPMPLGGMECQCRPPFDRIDCCDEEDFVLDTLLMQD